MVTCTMSVCDLNGNPLPSGITGELYIGGPSVAKGYWEFSDLTAQRFIETPDGRLYRTGDMAAGCLMATCCFWDERIFRSKSGAFALRLKKLNALSPPIRRSPLPPYSVGGQRVTRFS